MPLFGEYERRLRQILYITLVKAFQVDWLNQSFQKTLLDDITTRDNKNKLIENALEELTYEQLKTFLFVPFTLVNFEQVLESSLSETEMQKKSKDEIIEIINSCRKNSLWNMFFKTDKSLLSIPDDIEDYQKFRNKVMHNKYISYKEFNCIRKRLKKTNTKLKEAIIKLDASIYNKHETDAVLTIFNAKILEGICEAFSGYSASMKTLSEVFSNAIRSYWTISENLDLGFLSELSNRMNNSLEPLRKSFSVK